MNETPFLLGLLAGIITGAAVVSPFCAWRNRDARLEGRSEGARWMLYELGRTVKRTNDALDETAGEDADLIMTAYHLAVKKVVHAIFDQAHGVTVRIEEGSYETEEV